MPRRRDVRLPGPLHREAQRVVDGAGADFVVPSEPRKDRQSRRIGGGPTRRPERIRIQVEDRPRARRPAVARSGRVGCVQLVQDPVVPVDDQDVPVAAARASAFDRRVGGDGVRPRVALVGVVEGHRHLRRRPRHHDVRDAVVGLGGSPVGMQAGREPDAGDEDVGRGVNRGGVHREVPGVVAGERHTAVEAGIDAEPRGVRRRGIPDALGAAAAGHENGHAHCRAGRPCNCLHENPSGMDACSPACGPYVAIAGDVSDR